MRNPFALRHLVGISLACAGFAAAVPAGAQDPCVEPAEADRLGALVEAVAAFDPSLLDRRARRAFDEAADVLAAREPGLLDGCEVLSRASKRLERLPGAPFAGEASVAFDDLRDDLAAERDDLDAVLDGMDPRRAAALNRRLDALDVSAGLHAVAGLVGKGAGLLLRAARLVDRTRNPGVAVYGGPFRVIGTSLDGLIDVPLDAPMVIRFSDRVASASVGAVAIQIRTGAGWSKQVPGEFEVDGPVVTFRPRLPVLADLSDGGFQPGTPHQITILGLPSPSSVRDRTGDPVSKSHVAYFLTTADPARYFRSENHAEAPPPRVTCTVPADILPESPWLTPAGALDVPVTTPLVLQFNRVGLLPSTLTEEDVVLTMTEFRGAPAMRRIPGDVVLTQSSRSVRLRFAPRIRLPDRSRFVLQVSANVLDLTGAFPVAAHEQRSLIRAAALAEKATNPTGNLAVLLRDHPLEIDPRTFLVFTTRDEPEETLSKTLEFDGSDVDVDGGVGVDAARTTASFDAAVPGSVAATLNVAGGDGSAGDFQPLFSTTLDTDASPTPGGVFQYRTLSIPLGVTVTIRGSKPAVLRCRGDATIEGNLVIAGANGDAAEVGQNASLVLRAGGAAGPGGGAGGDSSIDGAYGLPGESGGDVAGGALGGGGGYETSQAATFSFAGGGGGGGNAVDGVAGGSGTYPSAGTGWNGAGGAAGVAGGQAPTSAATDGGRAFAGVGGAGGGAGGNNHYVPYGYRTTGAGGGGGGGALLVTAAGSLRISGRIDARGGTGGNVVSASSFYGGSPGGGGAGGTVALYSQGPMDVAGAILEATGGSAGSTLGVPWLGLGGAGANGFLRLEDGDGAVAGTGSLLAFPAAQTGRYDPASAATDPPSVFTGTWHSLGAAAPEILDFVPEDFTAVDVAGCTVAWEIQAAREDPLRPGKPDVGSLHPVTGATSDPARASGWTLLADTAGGIRDVSAAIGGRGFEHFRIRVTFTLGDGLKAADVKPSVGRFRIRFRYQQ
jgi:hypothetical protein